MKHRAPTRDEKYAVRRRFWDILAASNRAQYFAQKRARRLQPGQFRTTFQFTPTELGIECDSKDVANHLTEVAIIAQGEPTKENLAKIRSEILENTKQKFKKDGTLDLAQFTTTADVKEENNETNERTVTPIEL